MDEKELEKLKDQAQPEEEFDLESIMREFSDHPDELEEILSDTQAPAAEEAAAQPEVSAETAPENGQPEAVEPDLGGDTVVLEIPQVEEVKPDLSADTVVLEIPQMEEVKPDLSADTVVLEIPQVEEEKPDLSADTVALEIPQMAEVKPDLSADTIKLEGLPGEAPQPDLSDTVRFEPVGESAPVDAPQGRTEPFSEKWEPEYEQPMGEYVPPRPILFHPRSRLHELKRKLVAGPERRYYEISEKGFGKLQIAIFLSVLVVLISALATGMYALGMVQEDRLRLMIFGQFFAMLVSALLGSYQLIDGVLDVFKGRFSLNSMLVVTLLACFADGIFCLQELRVPCCAAFSLQVTMSLWSEYQRRSAEMGQMDILRKASRLDGIKAVPDYYDSCDGLCRGEAEVEDFMDHYNAPTTPEKVVSIYALVALGVSAAAAIMAGIVHGSVSFAVQVLSVSLLAAVPGSFFVSLSRPMAVLVKRLHRVGAVICGWRGIEGLSRRAVYPLGHKDLFPVGTCKLNGVKYYGSRDPDQVVAYTTAVITADGGGLVPMFEQLLDSRSGRHYQAHNLRAYDNGGVGAEVCGEPVLVGNPEFLKEMGVEIPEGTLVNQAVYAAIDGELCGVFAVSYNRMNNVAVGLNALCAYRGLRPVMTGGDFMLTEEFIRGKFNANTRKMCFPDRTVQYELAEKKPGEDAPTLAVVTADGLLPLAFAATGARSLRTAWRIGLAVHLLGGIMGLVMMLLLAFFGAADVLTPANMFLYEIIWLIPGLLVTEWTRSV